MNADEPRRMYGIRGRHGKDKDNNPCKSVKICVPFTTTYKYDDNSNLLHQYDVRNNHVEFTYDELNRKTQHIQHKASGNLVTQFTLYDAEGNLKTMIDPMGRTFTYDYDELDRQTDAYYPDVATPFNKIVRIHTEYDGNNNVTAITETKEAPDSSTVTDTTVNNYDNFDRLDDSTQRGLTIDYGYDDNGNRTLVSTPAGTTTYTYDSRNRLKTAVVDGLITTYVYYPDGKKHTVTYPNGTYVKYTYHPSNRIDTVANKLTSDGSVFSSYTYTYDKNGNRKTQVELQEGVTETTTYNYDRIDRMTDFTVTGGANTTLNQYTFEGYNRKTETVTENGTVVKSRTYNYDETDWLTSIADSVQQSAISYVYDNNGNTILKSDSSLPDEDTTFVYDSRNQLVQVTRGPPTNEIVLGQYDYNSAGLRVRHRLSERGDVDYYYDDNAVIEEHDASDDSLLAHYRYADRLLSLDTGAGLQYYHHDALGSTVNLTNDSGATQVSYKLDPWGHIKSQTGTSLNRQIFTGQEHDENTGLIYFGARYYDPDTARFLTQDSYLGEQNTPPSLHRYLYAYSNPTVYVDLYGNWAFTEWLLGSADERLKNADYAIEGLAMESADAKSRGEDYMGWSHRAQAVLFSGYKVGLQSARSAINAADFVIDLGHSQLGLHEEGGYADQRTLERVQEFDAVATSLISNSKKLAVATVEDPKGTYEALKSLSKEKVPELYQKAQGQLEQTYAEGDVMAVAGTSALLLGLIDPNKKAQGLKRTFNLLGETAEAVTDSYRKLKRVKKVVPKAPKGAGIGPVNVGKTGEASTGIAGPKTRIPSLTRTARYRVPDELTTVSLREVKNANRVSNTAQLRDFLQYSQETNRTFILQVRQGTKLSKPLQDLVDEGLIDLRRMLP